MQYFEPACGQLGALCAETVLNSADPASTWTLRK